LDWRTPISESRRARRSVEAASVSLERALLLDGELEEAALGLVELGGLALDLHLEPARGLVDQVYGLVGEEAARDVAVGEGRRGDEGLVLDAHAVVDLVALLEAAQDGHRVLHRGLGAEDGLEAALEGGVLLDVLAVLVEGGGAHAAELAPREGGLQEVGGVHRPLGRPGAHEGVELVDEEDDVFRLGDFLHYPLQTLLEFASILGAGYDRGEVEDQKPFADEISGNPLADDTFREALDNCGLPHPGFPDEHGIVLCPPRQDLDDPPDLVLASDDRVKITREAHRRQVPAVFREKARILRCGGLLSGNRPFLP